LWQSLSTKKKYKWARGGPKNDGSGEFLVANAKHFGSRRSTNMFRDPFARTFCSFPVPPRFDLKCFDFPHSGSGYFCFIFWQFCLFACSVISLPSAGSVSQKNPSLEI
jgi:hypothetical protein